MALSHDLVFDASDLDRLSIQCKSCDAQLSLSLKAIRELRAKRAEARGATPGLPIECPVCQDNWEDVRRAIQHFEGGLAELESFGVTFRILKAKAPEKGE